MPSRDDLGVVERQRCRRWYDLLGNLVAERAARRCPCPAVWPLKWHSAQVEVVTAMWLPWTICEWHDVQRSFMPAPHVRQVRRVVEQDVVEHLLALEQAPLVAAQAGGVVDLGPRASCRRCR